MPNRFLLLGCQRSGTTMLRLSLNAHPRIHVFDEVRAYSCLAGDEYPHESINDVNLVGYKIPRWTDLLPGPTKGDPDQELKASFHYRSESLVFIHRDPVDVVWSMCSLKLASGQPWIDHYGLPLICHRMVHLYPEWQPEAEWIAEMALRDLGVDCTESGNSSWSWLLAYVQEIGAANVVLTWETRGAVGGLYWKAKNTALIRYWELNYPLLAVAYEEFVTKPEPYMRAILQFLGMGWDEAVMHHSNIQHDELSTEGMAVGRTNPKRSIDPLSLGKGYKNLPSEARRSLERVISDLRDQLHGLSWPCL